MSKNIYGIIIALICILVLLQIGCKSKKPGSESSQVVNNDTLNHDVFSDNVRITEFQTPEEERESFKLPPGFEITLFASEPDIGKPINMSFDARGRLWVTNTTDYPFPAFPGHDKITILEDTDGDGKADKFTTFADSLTIPIGITTIGDGAIAYGTPNIYSFKDQDNDGKSDEKKVLLGPFGYKDTHGMQNNFIRGFDGWIYACYGFTNTSTVAGTDGDSITMVSGNSYRFLPDGSRIEQTTYGRVNPFGNAFDEWGYLYSLDCHTKPIYQLIRGADYPGFGKKEPSMGFAPEMMNYEFGSTANSGMIYYTGLQFPEEYRNNFYSGNVVTSVINRNTMTLHGSSPTSKREADFLTCSDPWFRPVDIKTGPDGSMYVADFYNRIIGHYEVPLADPGRDKKSGRIWKITYKGGKANQNSSRKDWSKASLAELIKALNYPQLDVRMNIANRIVDFYKEKAANPIKEMMQTENLDSKSFIQGLWILYRLKVLPDNVIQNALLHSDPMVQVHGLRVLTEMKSLSNTQYDQALIALKSNNPQVQRLAAEALGHFPRSTNLQPLIEAYSNSSNEDSHLKYTILLSLKEHLKNTTVIQKINDQKWDNAQLEVLMKIMPDVHSESAAAFTFNYIRSHQVSQGKLVSYFGYMGRYLPVDLLGEAISLIQKGIPDLSDRFVLYKTLRQGVAQKGTKVIPKMEQWAFSLAEEVLKNKADGSKAWRNLGFGQLDWGGIDPWRITNKPKNETLPFKLIWSGSNRAVMGLLHSPSFSLPLSLEINFFDNDIQNSETKTGTSANLLRIRLQKSQKIVGEYRATFSKKTSDRDLVKKVKFDLRAYQGQSGYIEVVDSTRSGSVGIGMMTPEVLRIPDKSPYELANLQVEAAGIVAEYKFTSLEPELKNLLSDKGADFNSRAAAASTLMDLSSKRNTDILEQVFNRQDEFPVMRGKIANALGQSSSPLIFSILEKGLSNAPRNLQVNIVGLLANSKVGIDYLLKAVKAGHVDIDVLSELQIKERLSANIEAKQQQQLAELTKGKNVADDRKQVILDRLASFDPASVTVASGKTIFIQNCSMCHQINGNGGLVGPQLDGIGNWGQKALTEKILNPNGNISKAFVTYNITLKNGKVLTGLFRRTEGNVLVFADYGGQEFSVRKDEINKQLASEFTLMPDHFSKTIDKKDFDALLKYLLTVK